MKIVIVGDGKVGFALADQLSRENNDITVIDSNLDNLKNLMDVLDVLVIHGNGASLSVQKEAGVDKADLLIAATSSDELNILACLVANGVPTMFGSIGIPTTTLASITGIDVVELSTVQAIQVFPFVVACPILMVMLVGHGRKALRGMLPIALVSGVSFAACLLIAGHFIGGELPDVVASVVSLVLTFAYALHMHKSGVEVPEKFRLAASSEDDAPEESVADKLRAWAPFALIFAVLLLTSKLVPFVNGPLSAIKSTVNIYAGDPTATLTFSWVNTPGVLIFICGIVGGLIQHCPPREMLGVLDATCRQMSKTIVTMLGVLACAKIMGYSGMIASISDFFVASLGGFYPLVAPLLGALGTFVTGSGTSSEVLFGNVQLHAAQSIGANETWLVASNSLGVSAGKMLSPQNIAIGCAACGLTGKDGEILGKIAPYAFAFALVAGIHARSHGPTVEDHGGGVLVFRGSGPQPRLDAVACASGIEAGGGAAGYSGGLQGGHHHGVGRVAARGEQGVFSIDLLHAVFGFEDGARHLAIGVNKLHHLMLEQNVVTLAGQALGDDVVARGRDVRGLPQVLHIGHIVVGTARGVLGRHVQHDLFAGVFHYLGHPINVFGRIVDPTLDELLVALAGGVARQLV